MRLVWLLFLFVLLGCSQLDSKTHALNNCLTFCREYKGSLNNGPCLSNNVSEDYVCDVAHNPRQAIDNLPENQCQAFREHKAHHFVELSQDCKLIRLY